jgi:hypothetical protein
VPEGSKLSVVAGDTLVGARENDDTVFGLPSLPVLVTSKALCQDHHQFEIVDTADDRSLHLYHLVGRGTSATSPKRAPFRQFVYLRSPDPGLVGINVDPLGLRMGARVFPEAFPTIRLQRNSCSTLVCYSQTAHRR